MPSINDKTYQPTPALNLAFLGLGVMGYPMAGHLSKAGHHVTVYNRTRSKAQAWTQEFGGLAAKTPKEAAEKADIVFCCVGNDSDLRNVVLGDTGALAGMTAGSIFIDNTTASAQIARELNQLAQQKHIGFIDAPVSGGQAGAINGTLTVMCGGEQNHFNTIKPIAQAFAQAVTLLGASGSGQLCKMVNQICIAGLVQGLSEAIAFGQAAKLNMHQVLEVIDKGAAQSWQLENRGTAMVNGSKFDFGFAVDWMRKDLDLVLNEAKRNGARVPVTALVDQFYGDVQAMGGGRWDTSSLITRLQKKK